VLGAVLPSLIALVEATRQELRQSTPASGNRAPRAAATRRRAGKLSP
jgi:hypothetical protein